MRDLSCDKFVPAATKMMCSNFFTCTGTYWYYDFRFQYPLCPCCIFFLWVRMMPGHASPSYLYRIRFCGCDRRFTYSPIPRSLHKMKQQEPCHWSPSTHCFATATSLSPALAGIVEVSRTNGFADHVPISASLVCSLHFFIFY